jgi:hypothetical protein
VSVLAREAIRTLKRTIASLRIKKSFPYPNTRACRRKKEEERTSDPPPSPGKAHEQSRRQHKQQPHTHIHTHTCPHTCTHTHTHTHTYHRLKEKDRSVLKKHSLPIHPRVAENQRRNCVRLFDLHASALLRIAPFAEEREESTVCGEETQRPGRETQTGTERGKQRQRRTHRDGD